MARRSSFGQRLAQYQRELEREQRTRDAAMRRAQREAQRAQKEYERAVAADERERKRLYVESRTAAVEAMNEELASRVAQLEAILADTLSVDDFVDFDEMKVEPQIDPFQAGPLSKAKQPPRPEQFLPEPLSALQRLVPGAKAKHERDVEEAKEAFRAARERHVQEEEARRAALANARAEYEAEVAAIHERAQETNREVDDFRRRFEAGDPSAVVEYFSIVLDSSQYPEGFPQTHRMAFVPESKQLVVEYELPEADVVPAVRQFKYVKARDAIEEAPRPQTQRKALYASLVAQTALRTLHELFEADRSGLVETIVFNGYVDTIDRATGQPTRRYLISVRTTRDVFSAIDLSLVEPLACLRGLNASVSRSPSELQPVRPVLDFSMVDARFIQESDVLGTLDQRPNLMELSPSEFEGLISNLFEKMGLETRQTRASRDGGVDCVAFDSRPILGGKVVIQAKRYRHTVGVSAVRDLFGTMQNEGASKGILVTTSGYGNASFEFAEGKPLELISGSHLLYLLAEHVGVEARIEPPEDWVDPQPDADEPIETRVAATDRAAEPGAPPVAS